MVQLKCLIRPRFLIWFNSVDWFPSARVISLYLTCTTDKSLSLAARKSGAWSWLPKLTSHPASISRRTIAGFLALIAAYSGVMLILSVSCTSAPQSNRKSTTSMWPCSTATNSGVWRTCWFVWLMYAPASSNRLQISTWPARAAHISGVSPLSFSVSSTDTLHNPSCSLRFLLLISSWKKWNDSHSQNQWSCRMHICSVL